MKPLMKVAAFCAAVAALLALTVLSFLAGREFEDDCELMRIGLEDTAGRVRARQQNLKMVRQFSDENALAKARALSYLVATFPGILTNQVHLASIAKLLDVDEVHVSDEKGILIAGVPTSYVGMDMSSSDQTRPFMEALSNPKFELVQDPMLKGFDVAGIGRQLYQYAGVARTGQPGIIQIGQNAARIEQAEKLTDVTELERTTRIGRYGRVSIRPLAGLPPPSEGFEEEIGRNGRPILTLESDCSGYRVRVWMPKRHPYLARPEALTILLVLDALLLLCSVKFARRLRRLFVRDLQSLRTLFAGSSASGYLHAFLSPVSLTCIAAFTIAILLCWTVSARSARRSAEDIMLAAAEDMRETFDSCVDLLLFYQGDAICKHYKSPEKMSTETVHELMRRYGLDELNIVDGEGKIIVGALADIGYDMASNPKSAEFNCLLHGAKTYGQPFRGAVEDPTIRRKYAGIAFPPPAKGYIQIGFAEERVKDDIDYWFADQARDWHVGESGFYIIAKDETGVIDSCGYQNADGSDAVGKDATLAGIGFDATRAPKNPDQFFTANLFGVDCLCLTEVKAYHRIITALPLSDVTGTSRRIVVATSVVLLGVLAMVVMFMTRLTDLVSKLRGFIKMDKERQLKDLALAKTIQTSSLPVVFPKEHDFSIFAKMDTAREVGGDFYDFYPLPDGKFLFLIADVSGKGVPAALFMMRAKAIIRASVFECRDSLAEAVRHANDALADHNDAEMFVTAWIATFDRATGEIEYVNAGHNPPLVKRRDGTTEWVRGRGGLVLAAMSGARYRANFCQLEKGDSIFLYTDGVTEAMNKANEQYGETRLETRLATSGCNFITEISEDIALFTVGAEQSDDITMLALGRRRI